MKISSCGIHGFHETVGIDSDVLLFHWKLESDLDGEKQGAYQVIVRKGSSSGEVLWDSGRCDGPQQRNIRCEPEGVNGQVVSKHVLDPGWTDYHTTVQYVAHDVTERLSVGENVLGAHIGNGFYAGNQGDRFFWPKYEDNTYVRYGNALCFFAELHLFYEDGCHVVEISDDKWRVAPSATLGALKYQSQPPVILHETFTPIKETSPRPGTICIDLGQNSSIKNEIEVEGEAGSEIIIRYGETTYEDGKICMPDPLFKEFETKVYSKFILAGTGGKKRWTPDFCFTSARYIQIEGVCNAEDTESKLPILHSVCGRHVSSASSRLGTMKTDKEDVNALLLALKWTFSSNLFSYHTDCPQIEKFAWLEVTHLLAPATKYVWNMESLYIKILEDILDAQERPGLIPTMAPEMRYMCGPLYDTITWGCVLILIPVIFQRYYGTTKSIAKMYRAGER
ncbi:putative alpha-l-rhamnosidase protein [Botrytis fragariae]|uniref:Putative alpha-l-rhamnosidase protein n=1 Tax=Botrytis fragariae TaxID=1964551 RepID=A0A8H6AWG0_9HELO|nr:putative alpha-l-rhamnosidase protein [Botrytis fragariae]KAF5874828.1 putative alpha-l-rhamnosidase protein [Botrytis fragariae]